MRCLDAAWVFISNQLFDFTPLFIPLTVGCLLTCASSFFASIYLGLQELFPSLHAPIPLLKLSIFPTDLYKTGELVRFRPKPIDFPTFCNRYLIILSRNTLFEPVLGAKSFRDATY